MYPFDSILWEYATVLEEKLGCVRNIQIQYVCFNMKSLQDQNEENTRL